jgi:hypothetical protein
MNHQYSLSTAHGEQPRQRRLCSPLALHFISGSAPNAFRDTARRAFHEYIVPLLPIVSKSSLATMFSTSMEVSPFITFLRIVSVAATAPYLGPKECERDKIIDEYYNNAKVSHSTDRV